MSVITLTSSDIPVTIIKVDPAPVPVISALIPGPPGADGVGDSHYTHNQTISASTWSITHSLGKRPSVTIVDSGDSVVVGEIQYVDDNSLTVSFGAEFTGKAYCN